HVGNEAAVSVDVLAEDARNVRMVEHYGAGRAAALDKAQDLGVRLLAAGRPLGLAGVGQEGFVRLYGLADATQALGRGRGHGFPDSHPKEPSSFEAAAKDTLKLAGT